MAGYNKILRKADKTYAAISEYVHDTALRLLKLEPEIHTIAFTRLLE